jgi:ABC-type phosphate transport system substrate-binding protein
MAVHANVDSTELAVYVNTSVPIRTVSQPELRLLFAGRKQYWPDNSKVTVYVLPGNHVVHQAFCRDLLQMYPYQLERIWQQITYSGQGDAPIMVNSIAELFDAVKSTPGAIGYGYKNQMTNSDIAILNTEPNI